MKRLLMSLLCLLLAITLVGCRKTAKDFHTDIADDSSVTEDVSTADEPEEDKEEEKKETTSNSDTVTDNDQTETETETQDTTDDTTTKTETKKTTGKKVIVIDPGHQLKANSATEPIGPGAKEKKAKVTAGATGTKTKIREAEIVLKVGKKLKKILEAEGYEVIMTRTKMKVNLSNKERADIANKANADVFIRLHCDGSSSASAKGASVLAPKSDNPYLTKKNIKASQKLCEYVIKSYCKVTGAKNRGVSKVNNMSGINWCEVPVCLIEMGFLSNAEEEALLVSDDYQDKCAKGMAEGINAYLNS